MNCFSCSIAGVGRGSARSLGTCLLLSLTLLVGACATVPAPPAPAPTPAPLPFVDLAIVGNWVAGKAEIGGRDFRLPKDFTLEIQGMRFVTKNGARPDAGQLVFHLGTPKGIDVIGDAGPTAGRKLMAIYRLTGEGGKDLEICYDLSGATRPLAFESKPDTQLFRITYSRAP